MKKIKFALLTLAALALVAISLSTPLRLARAQGGDGASRLSYPETRKGEVVDTYFGTKVADPYRWLEDDNAPDVAAWVEAENKVTFGYLDKISYRPQLKDRLTKLLNYPKYGFPVRRGDWFIFSKNDGLQNQNVQYIQKGLDGTPEVLLDPNKFSADGTSRLGAGPSWSRRMTKPDSAKMGRVRWAMTARLLWGRGHRWRNVEGVIAYPGHSRAGRR